MARDNGSGVVGGWGPFGESSGQLTPVAVENFRMLRERQTADGSGSVAGSARVNLLNWDGPGTPDGLMPKQPGRHRK
ncbi:hypothetical protein ACFXG4_24415 [Nocardia sp. NPDC059246]|uniref:hypothetical protein n=1 Tax=unclassified Nocardia TaxID=2637762 RepID=UPI0036B093A0